MLRAAGSIWLGMGLLGAILIYLSVVSVFTAAAASSIWYVVGKVRGDCVTTRSVTWSEIDHFYLAETFAA